MAPQFTFPLSGLTSAVSTSSGLQTWVAAPAYTAPHIAAVTNVWMQDKTVAYPFGTKTTPIPDTITVTTSVAASATTDCATQQSPPLPPLPCRKVIPAVMIVHKRDWQGWGLPWVLPADVPEASQAGEASEASEADEAHVPFHGNWTEIQKMCRDLCEEGHAEAVPVYRSEETSGEGSTETVIYCENCNAYGRVTNITSSDGSGSNAFLYL